MNEKKIIIIITREKRKVFGSAIPFRVVREMQVPCREKRRPAAAKPFQKPKRRRQRFCGVDEEAAGAEARDAAVMTLSCR